MMRLAVAAGLIALCAAAQSPANDAKVQLGRHLFYDKRMSVNGTYSCASCHKQELAFTDGRAQAVGATEQMHPRSSMSLVNLASSKIFNWGDPTVHSLEKQALRPMLSRSPVELGFGLIQGSFLKLIRTDSTYRPLFREAFAGEANPYTISHMARAFAAFERSIVSVNSAYDRFHHGGNAHAISESAKRGEILFFLDGGPSCFRCHGGSNFRDTSEPVQHHNTGLYFSYPAPNRGVYEHTKRAADLGKFKAPTLRNIAVTAPYMHDGSISTLEEVVEHYAAGGRTVATGPLAGEGKDNPNKDKLVHGFWMTPQNRIDLVEFLRSLTDEEFLHDPRYGDPWSARK
jgi:cytochrome c peroxidase